VIEKVVPGRPCLRIFRHPVEEVEQQILEVVVLLVATGPEEACFDVQYHPPLIFVLGEERGAHRVGIQMMRQYSEG
jgi:hypothetical protein